MKEKPISQNPFPKFELLPPRVHPLEFAGRALHAVAHFVTNRHETEVHHRSADDMLLQDPTEL